METRTEEWSFDWTWQQTDSDHLIKCHFNKEFHLKMFDSICSYLNGGFSLKKFNVKSSCLILKTLNLSRAFLKLNMIMIRITVIT